MTKETKEKLKVGTGVVTGGVSLAFLINFLWNVYLGVDTRVRAVELKNGKQDTLLEMSIIPALTRIEEKLDEVAKKGI